MRIDTKSSLRAFFSLLKVTAPAKFIILPDSPKNLASGLVGLEKEKLDTFSGTTKHHLSSLLKKVADEAPDLEIWAAIVSVLNAFETDTSISPTPPDDHTQKAKAKISSQQVVNTTRDLQKDWTNPYAGYSLIALQAQILECQKAGPENYYAKTMVFVQSSGTGKSRLADSFGRNCLMINFVLREKGTAGFPPPDDEIREFLREERPYAGLDLAKKILSPEMNKLEAALAKLDTIIPSYMTSSQSGEWQNELQNEAELREKQKTKRELQKRKEGLLQEMEALEEEANSISSMAQRHAVSVSLLQACFEIVDDWVERNLRANISFKELAATRHGEMAPIDGQRSDKRVEFCKSVVERAGAIFEDLIWDDNWVEKFRGHKPSQVHHNLNKKSEPYPLRGLEDATKKLMANLETVHKGSKYPHLVVVFDEASSLVRDTKKNPDTRAYVALNRILSCLKTHPIWTFFLSTESSISHLIPPDTDKPADPQTNSSRQGERGDTAHPLERFPPFLALQMDIEDRRRVMNPDLEAAEFSKPFSDFSEPRYMARFGRPLWYAYHDVQTMNDVARLKLVGDKKAPFDPGNKDHVLASLSFRLSLDVCLQNPTVIPLVETAVNKYMRIAISMDQKTGLIDTLTPSEPILSRAAMEHLCHSDNWSASIQTLVNQLLQPGLIEKGPKGELYARLVLILAHDCIRRGIMDEDLLPPFTISDFLKELYAGTHHQHIDNIPEEILSAKMNFNHFVPSHENLTSMVTVEVCHDLLRRSAAMHFTANQKVIDLLIPVYYGQADAEFDTDQIGVILVQVKNRDQATTPDAIFKEPFIKVSPEGPNNSQQDGTNSVRKETRRTKNKMVKESDYAFKHLKKPALVLVFDLGEEASSIRFQVSQATQAPELWAIHTKGHDETIFGCLMCMNAQNASKTFFSQLTHFQGVANSLAIRNKTFFALSRDDRYQALDLLPGMQDQEMQEQEEGVPIEAQSDEMDLDQSK